ncbi:bacteriophage abortive infection AbiH family protein [Macellibacteroides fermentans]|uniref:bacteriophage abortive infection AbiH family protein n=1 Tax=Macellibacteroides fermentans TaxID=879969 RepID=UPI00406C6A25
MKQDEHTKWVKRKKKLRAKRIKWKKKGKRYYTKLYVIGNGFDLHHGIPSSYSNFRDFLKENDPNVYSLVETYLGNVKDFWSEFEANLALLDDDHILNHVSRYLDSYDSEDWSDANHHDYQYEIKKIIEPLISGLKHNYIDWVLQLEIKHSKNQMLDIESDSLYLSFNYTSTLEKLYRIKNSNINHIHGKVINSDSDLIFGHDYKKPTNKTDLNIIRKEFGKEAYNEYLEELSGDDVRVTEGNDIINSYFTNTYKPTSDIIKENKAFFNKMKNIKEVIIIGHSLGKVDIPYFEEIFKRINNSKVKWIATYHIEKDFLKHRQFLKNIGVKDEQINIVKMDYFYPTKGVLFA